MTSKLSPLQKRNFETNIKNKIFSADFIYDEYLLKEFFSKMNGYPGPFRKSMWITHRELVRKCKEIGIDLFKNRSSQRYYVKIKKEEIPPVLFDTEFLDIPEEI